MSGKKLHFLGIAGSTMAGVAVAAAKLGYEVTGTDAGAYPPVSDWLGAHHIRWWREPDAAHLEGVDVVIISGGTPAGDVELVAAQERQIPVQSFAEFVGALAKDKRQIVVAGTHGKTTTSSLTAWLLESSGHHPDFLIGIQPHNFDSSVRITDSPVMVLEGDEYKASALDTHSKFSYYRPAVMVATALEMDHPDLFKSVAEIRDRFVAAAKELPEGGRLLYAADAPELAAVAEAAGGSAESYGEEGAVWQPTGIRYEPTGLAFDLHRRGEYVGHFAVPLYGHHNAMNATATIAVALGEGLDPAAIQDGLARFLGAARRFAVVSAPHAEITVIDDYAHHPTEIAATIAAAKQHFGGRVIAVVRPHTYSRVRELLPQFQKAVALADFALVTDIEGAREKQGEATVSGGDVAAGSDHVVYEPDRDRLIRHVAEEARTGDVVLAMTVSGYDDLAAVLAERLTTK